MPDCMILDTRTVFQITGYWAQKQYLKFQGTSHKNSMPNCTVLGTQNSMPNCKVLATSTVRQIAACWIQEHYASFRILGTRTVCRMQGTGTRAVCQTAGYWVTRTVWQITGHWIQKQYSGAKGTLGNKSSMPDRK